MGCGCKKRQEPVQQQVVNQTNQQTSTTVYPNNINQQPTQLSDQQQQEINEILSKIENRENNQ